jgi:pimeloyl-ACP methyl ester carboxylesterase
MWLDQLSGLARHRRCIALDLRGSGRSHIGLEPARAGEYHIGDVLAAIDMLGEGRVDLVGHSMGAHIAFAVAAHAPEKVRSVALFGAMKREEYRFPAKRSEDALRRPKEQLAQRFAGGMLASGASLSVRARALAMVMTVDWSLVFPEAGPESGWSDQGSTLGMPMLLSTGAEDEITPPAAVARLAAAHPGATFVEIARAGHLAPVENPGAVNSALAGFWDR